jgi:hypothetical protein
MVVLLTPGALALSPAEPVPLPVDVPDDPDDEFLELLLHAAARPTTASNAALVFHNPADRRRTARSAGALDTLRDGTRIPLLLAAPLARPVRMNLLIFDYDVNSGIVQAPHCREDSGS